MESVIARVLKDVKQSENGLWFEVRGVEGGWDCFARINNTLVKGENICNN